MSPSATSLKDRTDLGRVKDAAHSRPRSFLDWLAGKLSKAVSRVRSWTRSLRATPSRAAHWVRARTGTPARLVRYLFRSARSLFMATIGKNRGFGFWWLVVTAALALAVGVLVAVLLSPVIGLVAALVVAIGMLVRRSRSAQSRKTAKAALAN